MTPAPIRPSSPNAVRSMSCDRGSRAIDVIAGALTLLAIASSSHAAEVHDLIRQCAYCHGDQGIAKDKDVPNLAGQHREYLFNQLKAFRSGRRPDHDMRTMSRQMTDAEMRALADYYASLPPR
jgi:cytochrome c553